MSSIQLRQATLDDSKFILGLKNDETVRKFSLNPDKVVSEEEHDKWLKENLHKILIIGDNQGDLRIDDDGEISIRLIPEARGKGLGTEVLKSILSGYAKIVPSNSASMRSFEKAGFRVGYIVMEKKCE